MEYDGLSDVLELSALPDPSEKFVLDALIAEGAYGAVYQASDRWKSSVRVAVKVVAHISRHVAEIEQEYRTLSEVSGHAHFPEFYGVFLNKPSSDPGTHEIWFAMELAELGSAGELCRRCQRRCQNLSEDIIAYILASAVKGLAYLYTKHSVHRDVKADNLLVTHAGIVKLCDFGQVGYLESTLARRNTCVGSLCWVAPEVIACRAERQADYDLRCDVWSLGITALELCEGIPPLASLPPVRALFHIAHNPPPTHRRPLDWSSELRDFVSECLVKNPDHRPHMGELLEHPFLSPALGEDTSTLATRLVELCLMSSGSLTEATPTPTGPSHVPQAITRRGFIKRERLARSEQLVVEDLASLDDYNERVVVEALEERWRSGSQYTWLADVLIVLNTNATKHSYDVKTHQQYVRRARCDNAPHIFAVADKAYQDLMHHRENQTVVLTGESGSGKSFSFVKVVEHLCFLGGQHGAPLAQKAQAVLTVLDALGNAATELNTSATRHVRHLDVLFSPAGRMCGLRVAVTCLDKLRLTHVPSGEGNFHLLYYMYDGLSQTCRLPQYGLSVGRRYALLAPHDHDNEVHNANQLAKMEEALTLIGFTNDEVKTAYHILAAILHLGNMAFSDGPTARVVDQAPVREAARQLGVDDRKLSWALCHRCGMSAAGDVVPKSLSGKEASAARDALLQALYSRLVDTVVELLNAKLAPKIAHRKGPRLAVGVLDMAGFEATDHNGLEQLMVNVLNEQLQFYYNQVMFTWEMTDYESEGVSGTQSFSFPDNRHLLELFLAKRTGLLDLLEECAKTGGGCSALDGKLSSRADGRLVTRMAANTFAVAHYVGRVKYDITNMVERNKDHMTTELVHTLRGSSLPLVGAMFSAQLTRTGQLPPHAIASRFPKAANLDVKDIPKEGSNAGKLSQSRHLQTLGLAFRHSLITLLYRLTHSTPHFVRCIRGSMEEVDTFDSAMVKHQVKYLALCDTITIRQQGFSYRIPFDSFLKRYQCLAFDFDESVELNGSNARLLLLRLKMEGWAIGTSRVFLKYYMEEYLGRLYEDHLRKVVKIQAMIRTFVQLRRIRAGRVGPRSRPCSPEPPLARRVNQSAANTIANRVRFHEDSVEGEAARIVQFYFRRWKMRTLFQTLELYRADKMKQLVYFCQQVHLFNQECQSRACYTMPQVPLAKVIPQKPLSHRTLLKEHTKGRPLKLPLDHTLAVYFDTSYLCHPSRLYKQQDDDWEGPFKSRLAAQRASNMGSNHPLPSTSPVPPISPQPLLQHSQRTDDKYPLTVLPQSHKNRDSKISSQNDDEDQFKDLKEQIKLEKLGQEYAMTSMDSESSDDRPRGAQKFSRANKQLQTSFEYDKNANTAASDARYCSNYNVNNGTRELVYKSKRSESREGFPGNNIFNESRSSQGRDHYNRFAAVTPASKPVCPVYTQYNFSYINAGKQTTPGRPAVNVGSWQDRNRNSHNSPQAALQELQAKAQRQPQQRPPEVVDFQSQLRKTGCKRESMKRCDNMQDNNYYNNNSYYNNYSNNKSSSRNNNSYSSYAPEVKPQSFVPPKLTSSSSQQRGYSPPRSRQTPPPGRRSPPTKPWSPNSALQRERSREAARTAEAERYMNQVRTAADAMNISPSLAGGTSPTPSEGTSPTLPLGPNLSGDNSRNVTKDTQFASEQREDFNHNQEALGESFEAAFTPHSDEALL